MKESPISQTSTILAFGLHSDTTNCKAFAENSQYLNQYKAKIK